MYFLSVYNLLGVELGTRHTAVNNVAPLQPNGIYSLRREDT